MENKVQVFAVIRIDSYISVLQDSITIKEILPTQAEAEAEVQRLNKLNAEKDSRYFWQTTRYFPYGRVNITGTIPIPISPDSQANQR